MKKQNRKKLSLNKKTINLLSKNEATRIAGGFTEPQTLAGCNTMPDPNGLGCSFPSYSCEQVNGGGSCSVLPPSMQQSCVKPCGNITDV
jgi:hypothetical protein